MDWLQNGCDMSEAVGQLLRRAWPNDVSCTVPVDTSRAVYSIKTPLKALFLQNSMQ